MAIASSSSTPIISLEPYSLAPKMRGSDSSDSLHSLRRPSDTGIGANNFLPSQKFYDEVSESIQSSTESSTISSSFITHARENVLSMMTSLQERAPLSGWKHFLLYLVYYLLMLWSQMFVPTLRNHRWGYEGSYVFEVLNFPTTLLFNMIPYYGAIGLSAFFMSVICVTCVLFCLAYYLTIKPNNHFKLLKLSLWYLSWFIKGSYLIGSHLLVGFLDCNYFQKISITVETVFGTSTVEVNPLNRFDLIGCMDSENTIMIVLSICTLFTLIIIYPLTEFVTSNSNPQSKIPLTSETSLMFSIVGVLNIIGLICELVIPKEYSYVSSIANVLISGLCCITQLRHVPFFTHYENAIVQGVYGARLAASVGSLITSLVNSNNESAIGGGLVGFTIALMILGFVLGFLVQFVWIWVKLRSIRSFIIVNSHPSSMEIKESAETDLALLNYIEKMASVVYSDLDESKSVQYLNLFLKLSLRRKNDAIIAFCFVKGLVQHKMFRNVSSLIYSSLLVQTFWSEEQNSSVLATSLLRKAMKSDPAFFEVLAIQERIKEVESNSFSKSGLFEISCQIQKLEKLQSNLLALHKVFWKEMANEHINYESLKKTNRTIYNLTSECKSMLKNLSFNYKHNKTVLRVQANFIENFEFNKPLADSLYAEANSLEEEEMKKKRRGSHSRAPPTKRNNRIVPNEKLETASAFFEEGSNIDTAEQEKLEEMEDAFDNPQLKKEILFLNAIANPKPNGIVKILSFSYFLFVIACIVASIVLSVFYSFQVKSTVPYVEHVCFPGTLPFSIIRNIRACQNWINTFNFQEVEFPPLTEGYPSISKSAYILDHKKKLETSLEYLKRLVSIGQEGVFTDAIYTDYSSSIYSINFPTEDASDPHFYSGPYQTRNASIVDITNSLIKYTQLLIDDFPLELLLSVENSSSLIERQKLLNITSQDSYFNPLPNFNFNYLWANKGVFTTAYEGFCTKYLDSTISVIDQSVNQFMIYTAVMLSAFVLVSAMFIALMLVELSNMKKLAKLFETQIKKDIIGKIFHNISNRLQNDAIGSTRIISIDQIKPNLFVIFSCIVIVVSTCATIALMFTEAYVNGQEAINTMTRVRLSIQAGVNVERSAFSAQEFYTYFGAEQFTSPTAPLRYKLKRTVSFGDLRLWQARSRFDSLAAGVNDGIAAASDYMSKLIYGSKELSLVPLLGKYPTVDKIISVGVDNCTEYMRANNITFIYATFKLYCQGLETVFSDFASTAPQLVIDSRKHYILQQSVISNGTLLDPFTLAMRNNLLLRLSQPLIAKYTAFIKEFVKESSVPVFSVTISSSIIGLIVILSSVLVFCYMLSNFWSQYHSFRNMLNYLPIDVIDHNELLREFALHHKLETNYPFLLRKKTAHPLDETNDEYSSLKVVFNSSVEGTMICKENGEIELFNSSGLRMFGSKSLDILGTSMLDLFDNPFRAQVKQLCHALISQSKEQQSNENNEQKLVESLEVDMMRKNNTKFPAKITIYAIRLLGKDAKILITFKDITQEKKQSLLLADEKKKSENLLKNILPIKVANRLKAGETFIAEKFDDITCFFSDM
ncbi:predicted protein [Naegleria gruberi]|uniref:Predicted protein n=1 Tax=Naegleria gruberi TaxID=5762 RepID=D2UYX7_NAEGR|nr:uncharacterized protein NAEGRDRAFT_61738 [Naegleria gruberi]EFC50048.1 predicted protein [Naegleria gruberi]|eukprot:XP_002682792.1 predicted protein [Naegleria gruberi strain NEG-M]